MLELSPPGKDMREAQTQRLVELIKACPSIVDGGKNPASKLFSAAAMDNRVAASLQVAEAIVPSPIAKLLGRTKDPSYRYRVLRALCSKLSFVSEPEKKKRKRT